MSDSFLVTGARSFGLRARLMALVLAADNLAMLVRKVLDAA